LQALLGEENVTCALLTGSTTAARRGDLLGKLATGELSLLVGTHALIEPSVRFRSLALAVVDEQHRFGVRQRGALTAPHVLHMTATPIPRTLALVGYGDLDVSLLRQLPATRQPIETRIVAGQRSRQRAYSDLRGQLDSGRQAYVVCPLVQQPDPDSQAPPAGALEVRAAKAELDRLADSELSGYRLSLLHGSMPAREKQQAIGRFVAGEADVLVATTVIEVGIDVPNATAIVIENAERFGISQLHQLRGRVGRGRHSSICMLVGAPTSPRLRALVEHSDGFKLAEIDLELRKEGDLVGTRQSGIGQFRIASLPRDGVLLGRARACAEQITACDPHLRHPEHALLGDALERAHGEHLFEPIPV
jgi:ATP-dependent DNA helicase RecG